MCSRAETHTCPDGGSVSSTPARDRPQQSHLEGCKGLAMCPVPAFCERRGQPCVVQFPSSSAEMKTKANKNTNLAGSL